MLNKDPIRIAGPLGRIYSFTRHYQGDDFFEGPRLAFHHDRAYARDHLLRLTRSVVDDPFNSRLLDVWQLVFQKPWTRPRNVWELVTDLTDKIHRGELFVYLEPNLERDTPSLMKDGPGEGEAGLIERISEQLTADQPRVSGPKPASTSASWGSDYWGGLSDTASAISSDIASEQTELYENTSGWGNVMYPVFKPIENFGTFIGNTFGLMSALSPKGMNPKVAEYWKGIGDSVRALGGKVVDAAGGDGRAAGEITPAVESILVSKKLPARADQRQPGGGSQLEPADAMYDAIRASNTDIDAIAKNTGLKPENIKKVKDHVFYNEHLLDKYVNYGIPAVRARFDSDISQAQAWKRLENGSYTKDDIGWLKHEAAERWYEQKHGSGYTEAHNAAEKKWTGRPWGDN